MGFSGVGVGEPTSDTRVGDAVADVAGFFDWPREATGEDVAASMGISPATFHEHLRAAERRPLTRSLDGP